MSVQDLDQTEREVSRPAHGAVSPTVDQERGEFTLEELSDLVKAAITQTAGSIFSLCTLVEKNTGHRAVDVYACINTGKYKGGTVCQQMLEDIGLAVESILDETEEEEPDEVHEEDQEDFSPEALSALVDEILSLDERLDEGVLFKLVESRSGFTEKTIGVYVSGNYKSRVPRTMQTAKVIGLALKEILEEVKGGEFHKWREFTPKELRALADEILSLDRDINESHLFTLIGNKLHISRPSVLGYVSGLYNMDTARRKGVARRIGCILKRILEETKLNKSSSSDYESKEFTPEELSALVDEIRRVNSAVKVNTIVTRKVDCSRVTFHQYVLNGYTPKTREGIKKAEDIGRALEEVLAEVRADVFAFGDEFAVRRDRLALFLGHFGSVRAVGRQLDIHSVSGKCDKKHLTREQWANVLDLWKQGAKKDFTLE